MNDMTLLDRFFFLSLGRRKKTKRSSEQAPGHADYDIANVGHSVVHAWF